jgi:hypothetical protein
MLRDAMMTLNQLVSPTVRISEQFLAVNSMQKLVFHSEIRFCLTLFFFNYESFQVLRNISAYHHLVEAGGQIIDLLMGIVSIQ